MLNLNPCIRLFLNGIELIMFSNTAVSGFMGSQHGYDMSAGVPTLDEDQVLGRKRKAGAIDVALNPDDLESGMNSEAIKKLYQTQSNPVKASAVKEDLSDMVDEHTKKQAGKRQKKDEPKKDAKKFKF